MLSMQANSMTCPTCHELLLVLPSDGDERLVCPKCQHQYRAMVARGTAPPLAGAACVLGLASSLFNVVTGIPAILLGLAALRANRPAAAATPKQRLLAYTGIGSATLFSLAGAVGAGLVLSGVIPLSSLPNLASYLPRRRAVVATPTAVVVTDAAAPQAILYAGGSTAATTRPAAPPPAEIDTSHMTLLAGMDAAVATDWRWLHPLDGVDPATQTADFHQSFYLLDFDDASWNAAEGVQETGFGYGEPESDVDIGTPERGMRYTAYFRARFATEQTCESLVLECICDDAVIVYLDGIEVTRHNIDAAEAFQAFSNGGVSNDSELQKHQFSLRDPLPPGPHVLAISLHNTNTNSSDLRLASLRILGVPQSKE